jgi:hypothetical protein
MNDLFKTLLQNKKVDYVKKQLKESLDDAEHIKELTIVIETRQNLFVWAKSIYVEPTEIKGMFDVKMSMNDNPTKTLLAEIYQEFKKEEWEKPKYGHDKPQMILRTNEETINKLINWFYSKLN